MKFKSFLAVSAAFAIATPVLAQTPAPAAPAAPAPAATPAPAPATGDVFDTAKKSGQFNTFIKAVEATNLTEVLKKQPSLTVFAPTDAAFQALPPGELDKLMLPENRAQLQKLLTYHIVNARVDTSKIRGARGPVPTVAGNAVQLDGSGEPLKVNDATITRPDMLATNGVIHVVDKVLSPHVAAAPAPMAAAPAPAAESESAPASTTAPATPEPKAGN
ncbi:MAG TPA: fasciclin domain-containing protein [Phenylobacterium sp.]|nr:fasciclin domain-containing protein [Phenylobacterium sp.]